MDPQALSALISAAAGLLGALIGFAGAQLTHKRTVDLAREHRRFERAQEIQAEVIPRLLTQATQMGEALTYLLDLRPRQIEEIRQLIGELFERGSLEEFGQRMEEQKQEEDRQTDSVAKQLDRFGDYITLNQIWLPRDLITAYVNLHKEYMVHFNKITDASSGEAFTQRFSTRDPRDAEAFNEFWDQERESYEAQIRETRDWFEGERRRQEAAIWSTARKFLTVEE